MYCGGGEVWVAGGGMAAHRFPEKCLRCDSCFTSVAFLSRVDTARLAAEREARLHDGFSPSRATDRHRCAIHPLLLLCMYLFGFGSGLPSMLVWKIVARHIANADGVCSPFHEIHFEFLGFSFTEFLWNS